MWRPIVGQRAVGGGHDPYATAAGWAALDVNDAIVGVKLDAHRHRGDHRNRRIAHGVLGAPVGGVDAAASGR